MTIKRLAGWSGLATVVLALASTAAEPAGGNLRYSISVASFENKAGWSGRWNIGDAFGTILTDALQQSGRFITLGEADMREAAMSEQDLATAGRTAGGGRAPQTGRLTPAQLLVKGAITHVQDSTTGGRGGIAIRGVRLGGSKDKAEVNITIYIIDATTGQVKATTKVVGEAGKRGIRLGYSGPRLGGLTGDMDAFKKDNVGKACEHAVDQAVEFLVKQLETIAWEGAIMRAGDRIIINRGDREGVQVGQVFTVGTTEDLIDEDTGELLDRSMTQVGRIEVTEVREKVSFAKALAGGDKMDRGMTIQPAR